MRVFLTKFSLSLCLLFLSGPGHLHAQAGRDCVQHSSKKTSERSEQADSDTKQKGLKSIIMPGSTDRQTKTFKIVATEVKGQEEDEHESASSKKNLKNNNYFASGLGAQTPGHFLIYNKILPSGKDYAYTSSYRYLVLRAFRI